MLKLRVLGDEKKDVWLVEPGLIVGSATGVGMTLAGPGVKEKHAQIVVSGNNISLKNLCGDNQLLINGKVAGSERPLNVGDEITLAGIRLIVVDPKDGFVAKQAAAEPTAQWSIRANHSALNNRTYPIQGKMILGRSNECDIVLSVTHLSRKHAELSVIGNKLVVRDLDSANGTFVNGKRIKEETLQKGDELRLDTLSFTVIGQADELDKTSVRAAINPAILAAAAANKAASPQSGASAVKSSKSTPSAVKNPPANVEEKRDASSRVEMQAASVQPQAPASTGGGMSPMVIVGVVVVVILIAVVLYFAH
jgi:pSer/pThr/pTyr-binding forkhead associated (FHA) protein